MTNAHTPPPELSVIMTTYNGSRYVRETIESILAQTYADFEFVVIDDCSRDETADIVRSYADPRLRLFPNERNLGISESRNRALRLSRGRFIATTDQDDVSQPDRLRRQVDHLRQHPDTSVVASRVYLLMEDRRMPDPMPIQHDPLLIHFALFFGRHNTTYSSLCMRADFLARHDLYFDKRFHYAEDYELFSRMAEHGQFWIIPEELVGYRLHASNNSKVHHAEMSRNGMTFMRDCYARELGREVSEAEGWLVWNGLVDKQPCAQASELRAMGQVMVEFTRSFIARRTLARQDAQAVRLLAAELWNDIVDRSVRPLGLDAERIRNEVAGQLGHPPSALARWRNAAAALLKTARVSSAA